MLGRIIAVAAERELADRLAAALQPVGAVETHTSLDALGTAIQAALCVIHFDRDFAVTSAQLERLAADCRVIAVLPHANLSAVVDLMQASERVAGMMLADDFDPRQLETMAARLVSAADFGLETLLKQGTEIHTAQVGDHHEKLTCMAQVTDLAELIGLPRDFDAPIEQCMDEMLMNALYDAPVDQQGAPLFAGVSTKDRIGMRTDKTVEVCYGYDGRRFGVSVRDAFGSLERPTVLRVLHKCLHAEQQIDRKAGGAGVGLYLMVNAASSVYFNVSRGVATEAICLFDPEAQLLRLGQLGVIVDDARPERAAARRMAAAPRDRRRSMRVFAVALVLALGLGVVAGVVVTRSKSAVGTRVDFITTPAGATIEVDGRNVGSQSVDDLEAGHAYRVVARLAGHRPQHAVVRPRPGANRIALVLEPEGPTAVIDSEPRGALVSVDGKPIGGTPLTTSSLPAGKSVALVFDLPGHRRATARVQVPTSGEVKHVERLELSPDHVRVRFVSTPPGARIVAADNQATGGDNTYTPAEIFVEAGKLQRFTLVMPDHAPLELEPFTPPRGSGPLEKGGELREIAPPATPK